MNANNLERVYTIPLRSDFIKVPRYYRAKRAINNIKRHIMKHMKTEDVRIGNVLNEHVWSRGITNPPGKVTVKAIKQEDYVTVELEGHAYKVQQVQTEKTDKPSSFKDKLAAKLNQPKEGESSNTEDGDIAKNVEDDVKKTTKPSDVKSEEVKENVSVKSDNSSSKKNASEVGNKASDEEAK